MRLVLTTAAAAAMMWGGSATAQVYEYGPQPVPVYHHWAHGYGYAHHRYSPARNSWSLHHGRNPMGSAANGG